MRQPPDPVLGANHGGVVGGTVVHYQDVGGRNGLVQAGKKRLQVGGLVVGGEDEGQGWMHRWMDFFWVKSG